jgi:hypothetical protein
MDQSRRHAGDSLIKCVFVPTEHNDEYRCDRCGRIVASRHGQTRIHARCNSSPPSLVKRTMNFAGALVNHVARGMPTAPQAEIDRRLAICKSCPLFDGAICRHADCGCRISQARKFFNKLAWADQSCPIGKWNAIAEPD